MSMTGVRITHTTVREFQVRGPFYRILGVYGSTIATATRRALRKRRNLRGEALGWAPGRVGESVRYKRAKAQDRKSGVEFGRVVPRKKHPGDPKRNPANVMIAAVNSERFGTDMLAVTPEILTLARQKAHNVLGKLIAAEKFKAVVVNQRRPVSRPF